MWHQQILGNYDKDGEQAFHDAVVLALTCQTDFHSLMGLTL